MAGDARCFHLLCFVADRESAGEIAGTANCKTDMDGDRARNGAAGRSRMRRRKRIACAAAANGNAAWNGDSYSDRAIGHAASADAATDPYGRLNQGLNCLFAAEEEDDFDDQDDDDGKFEDEAAGLIELINHEAV